MFPYSQLLLLGWCCDQGVQNCWLCPAGMTWLLSSQVVQMTESVWLEQLKAYSQHIASLSQRIAAERVHVTNWLRHQQGLYALGELCC